ncbi:MAG: carbohydrate ABC transporter permease [Nitrososphaeria archaeon]
MSETIRLNRVQVVLSYLVIVLFAVFFFYPLFWMVVGSFKVPIDQYTLGFILWLQFQPTLRNWEGELIIQSSENIRGVINSTVIGLGAATIATVFGIIAGYALARYEFQRMKNINILTWFLALRFLPPIAMAIPFYVMMQSIGLIDNVISVIIMHGSAFTPYAVLVIRDAFKSMPVAMEESAMVDGASIFTILRKIALPVVAPALAAIFLLTFSFSWNEYLIAFVLTSKQAATMPIRLAMTMTAIGIFFSQMSVRQLLAVIPPIVVGILVQKYIVSGLTMGAIKA